MNLPFDKDIFVGKLLKWIIQTDQLFSVVDTDQFEDMMQYLKKDIAIHSRKTIMRRLEELYIQQKSDLKEKLNSFKSKFSMLVRAQELKDVISDTLYQHKDKDLFALILSDEDWDCVEQLIEVLQPLKEASLLVSESLMVTNMLPIYHMCTEILKECLSKFNETDDIYIGIEAASEKLNQYYDKISPVVGIALNLDPTMKKDFLRDVLEREPGWVESVTNHFMSSFKFYRGKSNVQEHASIIPNFETGSLLGNFKRRKTADVVNHTEEYVRYFNAPLAQDGTNPLIYWKTHQFDFSILAGLNS